MEMFYFTYVLGQKKMCNTDMNNLIEKNNLTESHILKLRSKIEQNSPLGIPEGKCQKWNCH